VTVGIDEENGACVVADADVVDVTVGRGELVVNCSFCSAACPFSLFLLKFQLKHLQHDL
jgi:hypothetical protein